jgi:CheY-like chemotaxis protein
MSTPTEVILPVKAGAEALPPLRVLVVDDNHDAADSLAMLLSLLGHHTHTCYDGHTALQLARTAQPQAVLLDIGLPGLDGYQVARSLRDQLGLRDSLLVAVTGLGREEDRRRCLEAGFDHFLLKPLDLPELEEVLAAKQTASGRQADRL